MILLLILITSIDASANTANSIVNSSQKFYNGHIRDTQGALNSSVNALAEINHLSGRDPSIDYSAGDKIANGEIQEELISMAEQQNQELMFARSNERVSQLAMKESYSNFLPWNNVNFYRGKGSDRHCTRNRHNLETEQIHQYPQYHLPILKESSVMRV
jgi:hypothetical protein